jgi:hypothetical protein
MNLMGLGSFNRHLQRSRLNKPSRNFGMICEIAAIGTNSAQLKWFELFGSGYINDGIMPALI